MLHFQITRSELCADAFEVFFRVQRAGMAEAAFRVVTLDDALVVEHETGGGRQCGFCCVEGRQLFVDGGLVDPSFVDQRLCHVDFVLENGDGGCRIGRCVFGDEVFALADGFLQGGEVAHFAVAVFIVQVLGGLCQRLDFLAVKHFVIDPEAIHQRFTQVIVGREGSTSDPCVRD